MSNCKTVSTPRSCGSVALALLVSSMASLLPSLDASAAQKLEAPVTPVPATTTAPNQMTDNPVIMAILKRLGVKTAIPKPIVQPVSSANLTTIEKLKSAYVKENSAPAAKVQPISANRKHSAEATPKRTAKQTLAAFYANSDQLPLWVSKQGLLKTTHSVIAEFKHADAYGLRPKDFMITKPSGPLSPAQLADFELKMTKTALKYAKYARGGRIDPLTLSRFQDRVPVLPAPEIVLASLDDSDDPVTTLRAFHPQHAQFKALRHELMKKIAAKGEEKSANKKKKSTFAKTACPTFDQYGALALDA